MLKSRFSYTIELRCGPGGGVDIFDLPPNQIKASGEELWAAQKVMFQKMVDLSNDETTPTPQPPTPQPPSDGCGSPQWATDSWCDDENNNDECKWDGGACCPPHEVSDWDQYCDDCLCLSGVRNEFDKLIDTLRCQINESTRLAFLDFFPTLLALFPPFSNFSTCSISKFYQILHPTCLFGPSFS